MRVVNKRRRRSGSRSFLPTTINMFFLVVVMNSIRMMSEIFNDRKQGLGPGTGENNLVYVPPLGGGVGCDNAFSGRRSHHIVDTFFLW